MNYKNTAEFASQLDKEDPLISYRDEFYIPKDENGDELFDLNTDSEEVHNVAIQHPDLVAIYRSEIESLLGQPLPGKLVEVCDPSSGPMVTWLEKKLQEF